MKISNSITKCDGLGMPYSPEAEQAVLGAVILDSSALCKVISVLDKSEYFYIENHQVIYDAMLNMYHNNIAIDFVTLIETLEKRGFCNQDCKTYLMDLVNNCPSISNAREYAKIVRVKHEVRSLIKTAREIIEECSSGQQDTVNIPLSAKEKMMKFKPSSDTGSIKESSTIQTGFDDIDRIIGGFHNGDLIYIGSGSGVGKTSFALNIARNVLSENKTVAYFTMYMCEKIIKRRLTAMESLVEHSKIINNNLYDEEKERIKTANDIISKYKLFIDSTICISVKEIENKLTQLGNVDLVIIDYIQLMITSRDRVDRVNELEKITYNLSGLAKKFNVPIICLTQVRRTYNRINCRPLLEDFTTLGVSTCNADIVLALHREHFYNKEADKNSAECIIRKNRNSERDITVDLNWYGEYMLFTSKDNNPLDEFMVNLIPTLLEDNNQDKKDN